MTRPQAAFFDLDKTIIAKSSTLAFSREFQAGGLISRRAMLRSAYAQFLFFTGGADHDQMDKMREFMSQLCAGWDVATVQEIVHDTLTNIGRSVVLVLSMGGLAYGLASLIRNTGAALGIGFVYFAIVELFINGLLPRLAPYTLTINIGALFTPGGIGRAHV